MRINDAFPSKFLSSKDLGNKTYQLKIARVVLEEMDDQGGKKTKPIIYFVGATKGMVLNRTNADSISMVLGDETDQWLGHTLELFTMRVQGPNGMTDGLRCRVILPQDMQPPRQPAPEIARPSAPTLPAQIGSGGVGGNVLNDDIPFAPCR